MDFYASIDKKAEKALKGVHWKRLNCCLAVRGGGVGLAGWGWEQVVFFCPYAHHTSKLTRLTVRRIIVVCFKCFSWFVGLECQASLRAVQNNSSVLFINVFIFLRQERGSTFVISLSYRKSQHQTGTGSTVWHIVKTNNWLLSTAPIPFFNTKYESFSQPLPVHFQCIFIGFYFWHFRFQWPLLGFFSHCKGINNFIHIC